MSEYEQAFYDIYDRLAQEGLCDSAGGFEYQRVLLEWEQYGCPRPIAPFIVTLTSRVPEYGNRFVGRENLN